MRDVADAVILAGGRGTRMLPSTTYVPKEIMPLVDTPILNHLIWEACKAGVKRIHIVISPNKKKILSEIFNKKETIWGNEVRRDLPRVALNPIPKGIEIILHEQMHPGGVGDAILLAIKSIKGPFLVILGDNLLIKEHVGPLNSGPEFASNACKKMVDYYNKNGTPCAGILEVPDEDVSKYGIIKLENERIVRIIEKPDKNDAPSNFILCGRYLLPENTEKILNLYPSIDYGELQSIELFNHLIKNGGFGSVNMNNFSMYDSGDPMNWLKSQIDHALKREELGKELKTWITERIS